jgi:hypothetical protein
VSTSVSPVTQVADTAVKTAVTGSVNDCSFDENGIISTIAPTAITTKKLITITEVGLIALLTFFLGFFTHSP